MEKRKNYIFKLNVQPHILHEYSENLFGLKNQIIPNVIYNTYNDLFHYAIMDTSQLTFSIQQDYNEIVESKEYNLLLQKSDELALEFKKITRVFRSGKGIHYDPGYLDRLESVIELRKDVCSKFIVLNQA